MTVYFCSHCGKQTRVKVPKGGYGYMLVPVRHDVKGFHITCPGSWQEAEERNVRTPAKNKK